MSSFGFLDCSASQSLWLFTFLDPARVQSVSHQLFCLSITSAKSLAVFKINLLAKTTPSGVQRYLVVVCLLRSKASGMDVHPVLVEATNTPQNTPETSAELKSQGVIVKARL